MAETRRTIAELMTLLADNSPSKAINAQRLRDAVFSLAPITKLVSEEHDTDVMHEDSELHFTAEAGQLYAVRATIFINNPSEGDFEIGWYGPLNTAVYWGHPGEAMQTGEIAFQTSSISNVEFVGFVNMAAAATGEVGIQYRNENGGSFDIYVFQGSLLHVVKVGTAEFL